MPTPPHEEPEWLRNNRAGTSLPAHLKVWKRGGPSPNPKGRPPGIVDKRSRIAQAFMDDGVEIAKIVIDAAKAGDMQAANLVLSRLQPVLKARAETVTFQLDPTAPLTQQAQQVIVAVAAGEVDPDTGKVLIDCLSAFGGLREVDELAERITSLEGAAQAATGAVGSVGGVLVQL